MRALAAELDRLNRERQAIEVATVAQAEAEAMAALGAEEKGAVVVTAAEGWHPGVVGLVAARLKERFGPPAFAIALEPGGIGTGSGRSVTGVDLGRAVRQAVGAGLLVKGGGHAMAAGVTLKKDALSAFRAFLEETLASAVETARRDDALLIDGAVTAAAANTDLVATIARAGPFGAGNPEPVIAFPAHTLVYADEVGQAHMRVRLRAGDGSTIDAIAFRALGQKLGTHSGSLAASPCTRPARCVSIAGTGSSGCSCGSSTSRRQTRSCGRCDDNHLAIGAERALNCANISPTGASPLRAASRLPISMTSNTPTSWVSTSMNIVGYFSSLAKGAGGFLTNRSLMPCQTCRNCCTCRTARAWSRRSRIPRVAWQSC
jgi:hypothetical protein